MDKEKFLNNPDECIKRLFSKLGSYKQKVEQRKTVVEELQHMSFHLRKKSLKRIFGENVE